MEYFEQFEGQVLPQGILQYVPIENRFEILWFIFENTYDEPSEPHYRWFLTYDTELNIPYFEYDQVNEIFDIFIQHSQDYYYKLSQDSYFEELGAPQIILDKIDGEYTLTVSSYHYDDGTNIIDDVFPITEDEAKNYLYMVQYYPELYNVYMEYLSN